MAILRSMDGKFYDVPDDQAESFEVPREKVKELLSKAGAPQPSQGPGPGQGGPGQHSQHGHPGSHGGAPGPVVVQIYTNGGQGMGAPQGGPPQGGPSQGGPPQGGGSAPEGGQGDVDPYWWWYNWRNYWPNWWGNY